MDKTIFFAPDIKTHPYLPSEESLHCVKVLRRHKGDSILITDAKGYFFEAVIVNADPKQCEVNITDTIKCPKNWDFFLQIAFAPAKNMDRNEWFVEKATEIGIDRITPLLCKHSERKDIKPQRIEKILVSAMKQSQKAILPQFDNILVFNEFVKEEFDGQKFIAHCYEGEKPLLNDIYGKGRDALILIGPEGDFSEDEVKAAIENGFEEISLGKSRLRTETAALAACHTIHVLNQ